MIRFARLSFFSASVACALALVASPAVAQSKGSKPKTDTKKADPPKEEEAPAETPKEEPKAEAKTDDKGGMDAASKVEPPREADWDITDVEEAPGKTYMFVGLRYRGNIVPKFMLNMFVDEGKTIYSNSIGLELDLRKDGFSLIPAIQYTEYTTGDILFKQKNTKDIPGNYSLVNSSMKAVYATADLLWSTKISKNFDFEYGAGFGIGVVFGDLINNWVFQDDPNGLLGAANGHRYSPCQTVTNPGNGNGCNKTDHQNSDVDKVGNYVEKSWFDGGSKPVIFPWIGFPQIGLRYKPIKQLVMRLHTGFSLTGFWFGINGEYGLERKPKE
jgi:hypothetical protein